MPLKTSLLDGEAHELSDAPPKAAGPARTLSTLGATAVLASWSTASSNVMYPWAYGVLGVGFGPVVGLLVQGTATWVTIRVVRRARAEGCATFGELGARLSGGPRGRRALEGAQLLNQMLWLPTAIVLVAGAVQELADESAPGWWACNVHVTWVLLAL